MQACSAQYAACQADPLCAAILDCVYAPPACPLDETGEACLVECVERHCIDQDRLAGFLAAESCAYCSEPCATACSAYCQKLSELRSDAGLCAGGSAGAGG